MSVGRLTVRDLRTMPFLWIHRSTIEVIRAKISQPNRSRAVAAYTALAYHTRDRESQCATETRKLGDLVGLSEATMKRALKDLVDKKIISKKARYATRGGRRVCLANQYTLLPTPEKSPATPSA